MTLHKRTLLSWQIAVPCTSRQTMHPWYIYYSWFALPNSCFNYGLHLCYPAIKLEKESIGSQPQASASLGSDIMVRLLFCQPINVSSLHHCFCHHVCLLFCWIIITRIGVSFSLFVLFTVGIVYYSFYFNFYLFFLCYASSSHNDEIFRRSDADIGIFFSC